MLSEHDWQQVIDYLGLSGREAQIAFGILESRKVVAIATRLNLSPHTVHTYRERLFRKLGIGNAIELVSIIFATHLTIQRGE